MAKRKMPSQPSLAEREAASTEEMARLAVAHKVGKSTEEGLKNLAERRRTAARKGTKKS